MTPSGIEPATFRFVAQNLNHRTPRQYLRIINPTTNLCRIVSRITLIDHSSILDQATTATNSFVT